MGLQIDRPGSARCSDEMNGSDVGGAGRRPRPCLPGPEDLEDLLDACAGRRKASSTVPVRQPDPHQRRHRHRADDRAGDGRGAKSSRTPPAGSPTPGSGTPGSLGGGKRPFGYRPDPDAEQYHRTLLIVADEAAIIRRPPPTSSTGHHPEGHRRPARATDAGRTVPRPAPVDALHAPRRAAQAANAGLTVHPVSRDLIDAPWPAVLPRDLWKRLRDKLDRPRAHHHAGQRAPLAGLEDRPLQVRPTVRVNGVARGRAAYVCGRAASSAPPRGLTVHGEGD